MINWDNFYVFAAVSICLWLIGAVFALRSSTRSNTAIGFYVRRNYRSGRIHYWIMALPATSSVTHYGETRLWYSFFMGIAGLLTYIRWQYRWILSFSALLATVFVIINLMKPEIHDQSLMPALQSIWFIPHVTVYMFSYSVLGCAFIIALTGLFRHKEEYLHTADNLVYAGNSIPLHWYAARFPLGKRSMGKLLELGSERDLGSHHLGRVFTLRTPPSFRKTDGKRFMCCSSCPSWLCRCAGTE